MKPNTGTRPGALKDGDKVRVKLNNGSVHEWTCKGNAPVFRSVMPDDHCWPFQIAEWEKI